MICVGESGAEEDGERLNLTDFVGGGCEVALRSRGGRDGDWARGVFTPIIEATSANLACGHMCETCHGGTHPPLAAGWARSRKVRHWNHREEHHCWERGERQHSHSHQLSWVLSAAAEHNPQPLVAESRRQVRAVGSHLGEDSRSLDGLARLMGRHAGLDTLEGNWRQGG